jgi:magnesium-transporting ATPase (P-type)
MSEQSNGKESVANHILPTSANLLGICFLIFSMAHFMDKAEATVLDECSAVTIVIFLLSSVCSYASLRSSKYRALEKVADFTFMTGLLILAGVAVFIAIKVVA